MCELYFFNLLDQKNNKKKQNYFQKTCITLSRGLGKLCGVADRMTFMLNHPSVYLAPKETVVQLGKKVGRCLTKNILLRFFSWSYGQDRNQLIFSGRMIVTCCCT